VLLLEVDLLLFVLFLETGFLCWLALAIGVATFGLSAEFGGLFYASAACAFLMGVDVLGFAVADTAFAAVLGLAETDGFV
jgi:hypothetical protein